MIKRMSPLELANAQVAAIERRDVAAHANARPPQGHGGRSIATACTSPTAECRHAVDAPPSVSLAGAVNEPREVTGMSTWTYRSLLAARQHSSTAVTGVTSFRNGNSAHDLREPDDSGQDQKG